MKRWLVIRDIILVVFGMCGLSYEATRVHPAAEVIAAFVTCLGLPPFLRIPRKGKREYDDDED